MLRAALPVGEICDAPKRADLRHAANRTVADREPIRYLRLHARPAKEDLRRRNRRADRAAREAAGAWAAVGAPGGTASHQEARAASFASGAGSGGTAGKIAICKECGNIDTQQPCVVCSDGTRDPSLICVVEEVADLWALERARIVRSRYHVLGGTLSPLDGRGPDDLSIAKLIERAHTPGVSEIILALNATVEGQSTAHYIAAELEGLPVKITRLARGVPIGGELDYLDEGTLAAAIKLRQPV